jgi:hypothetical protein
MFQIDNHAGRLIEMIVASPVTMDEQAAGAIRLAALAGALPAKFVIVADCRLAHTFPPDVADGFGKLMRSDNPRIQRSAILVGRSALLTLQVERIVREAQNAARRMLREPDAVLSWLGEVLDAEERARLAAFLAPPIAPPAS